jgi:hypothetical protein
MAKLVLFLNSFKLLLEIIMLVSSANNIELAILLRVRKKSFMYIRAMGPMLNPAGHHVLLVPILRLISLTSCLLLLLSDIYFLYKSSLIY